MSGWLAVRSSRPDPDPLAAVRARLPEAEEWTSEDGRAALAAWRRPSGEHRFSGRLLNDGKLAWVGQCLEDAGESTTDVVAMLRAPTRRALAILNGEFAAAVVDDVGEIEVVLDRHGHYPVYVARAPGLVAASTEPALAAAFLERPRFDREAVDLLLRCGELIDERTPLEGLTVAPAASRLRLNPDGPGREERYWKLRHEADPSLDLDDAATLMGERLRAALRRLEASGARLVAPLSGGLDSRLIVGLCERPERVPTFTWGAPGCRDVRYAELFARRVGSPHRSFEMTPGLYPGVWERGATVVGGCVGVRDMYILPFARTLAEAGDVALNGLAGDVVLGGNFLKDAWLRAERLETLADATWRWRVPDAEAGLTLGLVADGPPGGSAPALWTRSLRARDDGRRPMEILLDWLVENRVFRVTNAGTRLLRTAVESWSPFFDRDVMDLVTRLPLEPRRKHRFYLSVLNRACPAAAAVPWQRTALAPRWGYGAVLASLAFHRGMREVGKRFGIDPFPSQAVASPADWFRGPWAEPARACLFDERTLDRGLFKPDALRRLWSAHQAGADLSRALGVAISLELFARDVVDAPAALRRA
jgi:asparagine synthase (glutamine-hydrolysing)